MKRSRYALPYQVWMALFIIVPIFIVLYYACTTSNGASVSFSLENLAQVFSPTYLTVLVRSLWIALVAIPNLPFDRLPRGQHPGFAAFKRSSLILMLIIIPMWMNFFCAPSLDQSAGYQRPNCQAFWACGAGQRFAIVQHHRRHIGL